GARGGDCPGAGARGGTRAGLGRSAVRRPRGGGMKTANLLLGVGIEEIPDWMIVPALDDLRRRFLAALEKFQLHEGVTVESHATPGRIVMWAMGIPEKQADAKETLIGPPASAGEKAAEGFARKMGVEVGQLKKTETPKGAYWSFTRKIKGRRTT